MKSKGKNKKKNWLQKAREHWNYNGTIRPPFAVEPKEGQRSVWDFPRPPMIEKVAKRVTVEHQGQIIADSLNTLAVLETASPPTYYIPEQDVNMDMLVKMPGKTSLCEWKGSATYWALREVSAQPVAWSYPNPFPEFELLKDHWAFYPQYLDCYVDGTKVRPQPGGFYAGWITPDLVGPFKGEPGTGHW
ncbi:DUF427 domain-containing protein [Flavobacteriaceae bacterium TP-CH-4]|uniref:DUF427 domain-containing protein n=1 Tax=Pelagihabitans pacificus TaxID=2696054 RepID=A0A967AWC9_9FLAO|nr:DUF427 domain-containing protein [Pelagihabitans pacificus]NHF60355.1 DUF427 domain-containing protein [Pelagihabitans pacificus]